MRYFLYARKSTDEEDRQILSIQAQLAEVREYAKKENITIANEFIENMTAKAPGRPIFNQMLTCLEKKLAEGIIAWHPDRLARNSLDGGKIIYFVDKGTIQDLKFPTYRFDNTAQGKFMLSIAFGQSKYYVDNLSENIKRGIRQKIRNGIFSGPAPVGYSNSPQYRTIIIDPIKAPLVRKMFELYATGEYSIDRLIDTVSALGLTTRNNKRFCTSKVVLILSNPFYYGVMRYWGELFEGKHEPIITKKLFERAQQVLKNRSKPQTKGRKYFVFRGLFHCGVCGGMITAEAQKRYTYYHCSRKKKPCKGGINAFVREEEIIKQVQGHVQKVSLSADWADNILRELNNDKQRIAQSALTHLQNLEVSIKAIDARIARLIDVYLDKMITLEEYQTRKNQLVEEKRRLQEETRDFADEGNNWFEQASAFVNSLKEARYALNEGNLESQKEFLKKIGSNCMLKERRLIFSAEGTFRPVIEAAPWRTWWS